MSLAQEVKPWVGQPVSYLSLLKGTHSGNLAVPAGWKGKQSYCPSEHLQCQDSQGCKGDMVSDTTHHCCVDGLDDVLCLCLLHWTETNDSGPIEKAGLIETMTSVYRYRQQGPAAQHVWQFPGGQLCASAGLSTSPDHTLGVGLLKGSRTHERGTAGGDLHWRMPSVACGNNLFCLPSIRTTGRDP